MSAPLFASLRQVCTVVDDLEATVQRLVDDLGLGPFKCWHFRAPQLFDTTFRGQPAVWSMKLAITWLDDVQWEVIQPMEGPSLYREHLETRGRGVQHLLISTGEVGFGEAAKRMAQQDHPFAQTARANTPMRMLGGTLPKLPNWLAAPMALHFGYIDATRTLRTSIEMTRYPRGMSERFCLRSSVGDSYVPEKRFDIEETLPNARLRRIAHVRIGARDLADAERWWRELGGTELTRDGQRSFGMIGATRLVLEQSDREGPLALGVSGKQGLAAHLAALGDLRARFGVDLEVV